MLGIFEAADLLIISLLEAFSDEHIGYGTLVFENLGYEGSYVSYIDDVSLGANQETRSRVLVGEHQITIVQRMPKIEKLVYDNSVVIQEGEISRISFKLEETPFEHRTTVETEGISETRQTLKDYSTDIRLRNFYFQMNMGGIAAIGWEVEAGFKILPGFFLGARVRTPGIGLAISQMYKNVFDGELQVYSVAPGICFKSMTEKSTKGPHRFFWGVDFEVQFSFVEWTKFSEETEYDYYSNPENNEYLTSTDYTINNYTTDQTWILVMPFMGYRIRFSDGFFITIGIHAGAGYFIEADEIWPYGQLENAFGFEF